MSTPRDQLKITVVSGLRCPTCGAGEEHPDNTGNIETDEVLIRAFKVQLDDGHWWSQCLVCSGGYDENLVWHQDRHDPEKGWF